MTAQNPNSLCPLCQRQNHCAIAADQPSADCWCMTANIDPQARRAAAAKGETQRCLCSRCGAGLAQAGR